MNTISTPLPLKNVKVSDSFWKEKMELVRNEVIPYQWEALNDCVKGAAPSFCMRNFKLAAKITKNRKEQGKDYCEKVWPLDTFETLPADIKHPEDRFYGFLFQDSDFYKWIEAVAYSLTQHPDKELESIADEAIETVCAAQQENGYLDTYYIINDMSKVFTNLHDNHELYCFGHLAEGAVAYYQATGKDKLLGAACRFADYICECFGDDPEKKKGYPGHEIAEMALIRLYGVTKNEKYKELCEFFINQRGVRPYYFDSEHPEAVEKGKENELRYAYNQAHLPVREQTEAVGHAVRAVYLYSGMADVACADKDKSLYDSCLRLWDSITKKKMYITGGIGATHFGEAFSYDYDLPNDTAYSETCAAIGLVFFASRMLRIKPDRRFADVMERALYNTVLAGMALDGKSFFYVNPLEVFPKACYSDPRVAHVKPVRQKWFGCACCPPNIARLVSSLPTYAYTESEDTLFAHLYIGGGVKKQIKEPDGTTSALSFDVETDMPWGGTTVYICTNESSVKGTLALRIPEWSERFKINGKFETTSEDGYIYITREWSAGDKITLELFMQAELLVSDIAVRENSAKAALRRGPFIYCLEEADNGNNLHALSVCADESAKEQIISICGNKILVLKMSGKKLVSGDTRQNGKNQLYSKLAKPRYEDKELTFVPYYAWANRGEGEMRVWVPYIF